MDFRFGFVAIFLILDVTSVRSQGSEKNSNKVHLSSGIANNPFLQSFNFPITTTKNTFLINNQEKNPFLSNNVRQQQENNPSPNINYPYNLFLDSTRMEPQPFGNSFTSQTHTPPKTYTHTPTVSPLYEDLIKSKLNPVSRTISERKCEEYVGEIWGTTLVSSLAASSSGGVRLNNGCGSANRLIIGGIEAQDGEFPHMVALGTPNSDTFTLICGGTLISHTWVLSAAHCTFGKNIPTDARIGFHRLSDQKVGVTIPIKNMIVHEEYKSPALYADISLVQLMNAVTFSTSIRPACLYQQYDTVPQKAWATGWGIIEYAGEQNDELRKVQLDLIDNLYCTVRHNSSTEVPDGIRPSMICAGDRHNWTKDTCLGDSGGPLQIYPDNNLSCLFQVIGITSFGQGCASGLPNPAVYTRVPYYIPWIEKNVWPQG